MVYQNKSHKKGFSLLEVLIVIGIFAIVASISTASYYNYKSHTNLELATNGLVEAIRFAQASAESGKFDSKWGVKVFADKVLVFKGDSYDSRDLDFEQSLSFSGNMSNGGLSEIVFEKLNGETSMTGTMTLTNEYGSKNININEKGTVTY
jgi:prepilin-type N-terminal cleavage/methylation domain-containing protein